MVDISIQLVEFFAAVICDDGRIYLLRSVFNVIVEVGAVRIRHKRFYAWKMARQAARY